jgi:SAM-dependent methyltransferase
MGVQTRAQGRRKPLKARLSAKNADKFRLYEESVQDTHSDIQFIQRVFKKERQREPRDLREDFCGTAKLCADWVHRHPERTAVGLDLHEPTLRYAQRRHIAPLGSQASRVHLLQRDVLEGTTDRFDVILAFNFSYSVFKTRRELLRYFQVVHRDLKPGGGFFLDLYGGPEAQNEVVETTRMNGFTYVWEQKPLDAVSGWGKRYIHFRFTDGSEMKRAFTYDWRLWSLPELRDLLDEAGFASNEVYWEGADEDGEGNGIFRKVRRVDNEDSWIAYLVGWR